MFRKLGLILLAVITLTHALAQQETPSIPAKLVISLANVRRIELLRTLQYSSISSFSWSSDSTILAVSDDKGIWLYDAQDFDAEPRFLNMGDYTSYVPVEFIPHSLNFVLGDDFYYTYSSETLERVGTLHHRYIGGILGPDGKMYANWSGNMVRIYDVETGGEIATFPLELSENCSYAGRAPAPHR